VELEKFKKKRFYKVLTPGSKIFVTKVMSNFSIKIITKQVKNHFKSMEKVTHSDNFIKIGFVLRLF